MPLAEAFAAAEDELLRLVNATGVIVSFSGTVRSLGCTPPPAVAERAFATLHLAASGEVLAVDDLGLRHPALADCTREGSGALLLPLTQGTDDAILWFRPEQSRTVSWGGNPAEHATVEPISGRLSPRMSFDIWKETVRGRSAPWSEVDLALARDLRSAVEAEVAQRIKAELAQLRRFDSPAGQLDHRRELERSNADLEQFAYAASHDLKAPLRAIDHLARWIEEDLGGTASPSTTENLKLLQGRVTRLQFLLEGLLTYSRVYRESYAAVEEINIEELVRDIVSLLAPAPGFVVTCEGDIPKIRTHRIAIETVLTNLISNGIKHHDRAEGCITVTMRLVDGVAEFHVTDDGPGIAPRFHNRVFEIFQTLASRDDVEASGIGLAIVKKRVQANGGQIWIESAPPTRGTAFVFTWNEAD
jgi:light-regulated signal transduction histidine kinase (bacteriophytochrome)